MFNHMHNPAEIIPYSKGKAVGDASIVHPLFDYVPPDLVSLFISNM
jgi:translation initiation factor 2B subunit (eIF-2B alpha/beta/delta family)